MADETVSYVTVQPTLRGGFLAVLMVWNAPQDSYYPEVLDGPLKRKEAVSVALAEAARLGLPYRGCTASEAWDRRWE